ncbi:MAG: hypothetical protein ABR540_15825 [Acidimicrobiales bacterium]
MTVPPDAAAVARVERWFLSRGLPHFSANYSASRDVFTRALPLLTLILLFELVGTLNFTWEWWVNVVAAVASFGTLLTVWAVSNRLRSRRAFARPDRVGPTELAVFVFLPALLPLLAGGQRLTALNTLIGNLLLVGAIYLVTSYGVLPMTRWALGRLGAQLGALLGLMVRALPLLLLFVVFLFLTTEVWEVAGGLNGPFLAIVIGLFVVLGVIFVVGRVPREVGDLARFASWAEVERLVEDTPASSLVVENGPGTPGPSLLSRRQWGNVGLVVLFSQGLQVLFVSLMIGAFLVAFGLVAVTPETAAAWSGQDVHVLLQTRLWGRSVALTAELLQVAGLLAAVAGFSFTLSLLTDEAYRREFLEDVLCEVRQALAVRAVYLAARG